MQMIKTFQESLNGEYGVIQKRLSKNLQWKYILWRLNFKYGPCIEVREYIQSVRVVQNDGPFHNRKRTLQLGNNTLTKALL